MRKENEEKNVANASQCWRSGTIRDTINVGRSVRHTRRRTENGEPKGRIAQVCRLVLPPSYDEGDLEVEIGISLALLRKMYFQKQENRGMSSCRTRVI